MARRNPQRPIPSLGRRAPVRAPRRRFFLFCEGQNTEPDYFRALRDIHPDAIVEIVIEPAAGVPMTLAAKAVKQRKPRRRRIDSYEENDEIWAIFDRDEHPRFEEAVLLCESNGVNVARSNPCFEVWLILHHQDFHRPGNPPAVQAHLALLCPGYDPKGSKRLDCVSLMPLIAQAERRAKRQLDDRDKEGRPYGPPSTTVFHLTQALRNAVMVSRPPSPG